MRRELDRLHAADSPLCVHISTPDPLGHAVQQWARTKGAAIVCPIHTRFAFYIAKHVHRSLVPVVEAALHHLERRFYTHCHQVLGPSPAVNAELASYGIVPDGIVQRGVDTTLFRPGQWSQPVRREIVGPGRAEGVVVLYVGRLVVQKGLDDWAATMDLVQDVRPPVTPAVVGTGAWRAQFEARLPGGRFLGPKRGEDLAAVYASADIYLTASQSEGFANTVLEAQSSGLAVVAYNASGMHMVQHGVTGLLVDPRDGARGLADAVRRLALDGGLRRRLGANAVRAAAAFSWDAEFRKLEQHYLAAIAATGHRQSPEHAI